MDGDGSPDFGFRALEFHSHRMWQWAQVERALGLMQKLDLNALVFHQNDMVEHLVFPEAWFPDAYLWKRNPVRLHSVHQNRHYINTVIRACAARGIAFYLEVKEISFADGLLELKPELRRADGTVDPADPFWWRFLEAKYRELLAAVPGLAGVIVSPGTRESKVSIATHSADIDATEWYARLLGAMHAPLAELGRTLAVRDFSYTADQQSRMIEAAGRVSSDIVVSLKNTPHDYYPTFPTNPRIGHCGPHRQWVEFDTWGQFFGLGTFPVSVVEDMQRRMRECRAKGVEGISLRTDWEVITDCGALNGPNLLNVFAGSMLARRVERDLREVYDAWAAHGLLSPLRTASQNQDPAIATASDAPRRLEAFMKASWSVMEKAAYVRGHLFHEDDQYPESLDKAFAMLVEIHGRDEWEPGASRLLEPTPGNIAAILAEKRAAMEEVGQLPAILSAGALGLPAEMVAELGTMLELYALWVEGFEHCARTVFLARRAEVTRDPGDAAAAAATLPPLRAFCARVAQRMQDTAFPHYVYWLMDERRLLSLADDVARRLAAIGSARA
ncbi:hypothetical protein [Falsiroseomonas oryzae]|uniref:hypothetical protein n=1 Tax=Falsiroseomonas oryzae TaxID=2766473 RepID=UPI0022EB8FBE|nr:hypothetical protein [Roseomonas sp. MO-31]